jgi:glucokinase
VTAVAIGVDVGGTNVRVAGVAADGTVVSSARVLTPVGDANALVSTLAGLINRYDSALPVGVGLAGGADADGVLQYAPNLRMSGAPVGPALAEALGRRARLGNDATLAAWGEHAVGAAVGVDDVVLVTVGTGVGGGAVIGGRLLTGAYGLAGEVGHMIVAEGGAACGCGNNGCLEALASGSALALGDRDGATVAAAARAGEPEAAAHVAQVGCWLGVGMASLIAVLDPALVLVGGGAGAAAFDLLHPAIESSVAARLLGRGVRRPPPVRRAALGDDAGVVGAAFWALEEHRS